MDLDDLHEKLFLTPTVSNANREEIHLMIHGAVVEVTSDPSLSANKPPRIRVGVEASIPAPSAEERQRAFKDWHEHRQETFLRAPVHKAPVPKTLPRHSLKAEPERHEAPNSTPYGLDL